ncbi:MAG: Flp pilus assembly protein CpaB [Myxococcaceae bacterium]
MLKGRTPLIVALVLALLAGVVSYSAVQRTIHQAKAGWNLVPVTVAADDIPEGTIVTYEMVSQRAVPEQFITSSVVKPDSAQYIVNQKVLVPLQKGDPLLWSQFETTRASEKLSTKLMSGARALTLEASPTNAVGGWIRPNDHVDVVGTFRNPDTNESMAVTLLQNVIVVSTGKITGTTNVNLIPESQRDYNNVSLLVTPTEAELLILAQETGTLTLTLRNENDSTTIAANAATELRNILSGASRAALQAQHTQAIVDVIRGTPSAKSAQ